MSQSVLVQIIGAPIACADGVKDTWRDVAHWVEGQLKAHFGDEVVVKYYDLFDADCPPMPADAQLPLVLVNGEVIVNGGKIAIPVIRRKIEAELMLEKS
jgi:disulfide oxidoreductase YuzD